LLAWLVFIPIGRYYFGRLRGLMYATVFQWHILPFIVGVGLILSGSLWLVLILPAAWILSFAPFFPYFIVMYLLVIVSGWVYGGLIFSYFSSTSKLWYYASRAMGVLFMFISCTIIMAILGLQKLCRTMKATQRLRVDSE